MIKKLILNTKGNLSLKKYLKKLGLRPLDDVGVLTTDINGVQCIIISKELLNFSEENKIIESFSKTFMNNEKKMFDFLKSEILNPEKLRNIFFRK